MGTAAASGPCTKTHRVVDRQAGTHRDKAVAEAAAVQEIAKR